MTNLLGSVQKQEGKKYQSQAHYSPHNKAIFINMPDIHHLANSPRFTEHVDKR
jgi:hypothetical protein